MQLLTEPNARGKQRADKIAGVHFEIAECKLMRQTLRFSLVRYFMVLLKRDIICSLVRNDIMDTNLSVNMFYINLLVAINLFWMTSREIVVTIFVYRQRNVFINLLQLE